VAKGSLFDPVPLRGDPGRYTESEFSFLSRADGPAWQRVRDLLEDWYTVHPDRNGGLRARFREHDIRQHAPAWWELYTYTLFRRLGYEVAVDPDVPKGKADLLVTGLDSAMYVECVVLFKDGSRPTLDGQKWLCDCIDAANKADFHVGIRGIYGHGSRPKERDITKRIEDWLGSLDYDSIRAGRTGWPSNEFKFGEWRVSLSAVPVSPDRRGMAGGHFGPPSGTFVVSSVEGIRELLVEKASQCRGVDAPLIVAVLNRTTFASLDQVDQAVFGSETISRLHDIESDQIVRETVRGADGYWRPGPPPRGGQISAVMFGEHLHASRILAGLPTLWLNPWANKPLREPPPFTTRTIRDTGEVFVAMEATTSAEVVFGLPSDWPENG
jgi:hypothetical protein